MQDEHGEQEQQEDKDIGEASRERLFLMVVHDDTIDKGWEQDKEERDNEGAHGMVSHGVDGGGCL